MRLNRLTGLERENLLKEIEELNIQIEDHKLVINDASVRNERLIQILKDMEEEFGDERRTEISEVDLSRIDDEDLIPEEEVVITISNKGYIKRMPLTEFRVQNRGGTGSRGATTNEDDFISDILVASTHTDLLFFTSFGKVFKIRAHKIPQLGKTAKGLPIVNLIQIEEGEQIKGVLPINEYEDSDIVFVTKNGLIKRTSALEFKRVNRNGKKAIILKDGDELFGTKVISGENTLIIIGNSNGKAIKFRAQDVRRSGRNSAGVRGIDLDGGVVVDFGVSTNGDKVFALSEKGFGKLTKLSEYRLTNRGGKGVITMNTSSAGELVALGMV
jgi:DNA gyrase subunit A